MTQSETLKPGTNETLVESTSEANMFRDRMSEMFGIDGTNPSERIEQLQELSVEGIAILLEDINKQITGSEESMVSHDRTIKIGDQETIAPEDRYSVFVELVEAIKSAGEHISPERIADTLALGVVLLHPFKDGNGRTARTLGLLFRENYDASDFASDFETVTSSRDELRQKGGWMINGYIPKVNGDQSKPDDVLAYLKNLLNDEAPNAYVSCFGQAPLNKELTEQEETTVIADTESSLESHFSEFETEIDHIINGDDASFVGEGMRSKVYKIQKHDAAYAVRVVEAKKSYDTVDAVIDQHLSSSLVASGIDGLEHVVAVSHEKGVLVSDFVDGQHMAQVPAEMIAQISSQHIDELIAHRVEASKRGIKFDTMGENLIYNPETGFTDIDYGLGGKEMDTFRVICSVFESLNLVSPIELEQDPVRKAALIDQNAAVYKLIGTYCKNRFSSEFRDRLANQFQLIRANMVAHAKSKLAEV